MKKVQTIFALSLCSVLALTALSGCGGTDKPIAARICYDNLPDDNISVAVEDTQYAIKGVKEITAVDASGQTVDPDSVATYDSSAGILTAVSAGTLTLTLGGGKTARVEVVPAYVTDPDNRYSNTADDVLKEGNMLGGTHDPSLIEVEEDGKPAYYIFSTGWDEGNEIRRSTDLIHWQYMGKATTDTVHIPEIEAWEEEVNQKTTPAGHPNQPSIQWWAPDIVPAHGGGYWLYTCCVSNLLHAHEDTMGISLNYSKACIVLFHSDTLEAGTFTYVGVLMQSCIPDGSEGAIDVNSIDPQIIYDTDGKMYMAYGSFGTGNWMLELDPKTGLRKDDMYKNGAFLDWQTVRTYRTEATGIYTRFSRGEEVTHEYYGTMISQGAMEAPVIARHDNVVVSDENGVIEEGKTFYYSMHSYNGLAVAYQMWGGRSESPWGKYTAIDGEGVVYNDRPGASGNSGNKYMGSFTWSKKSAGVFEPDIVLPGHNDLFTTNDNVNIAAYITRSASFNSGNDLDFVVQLHQYYLNSFGDICINPNRYGKEIDRAVSKEELFAYTDQGRFQMVALENGAHAGTDSTKSVDVSLTEDGKINYGTTQVGTWQMYGRGYIKFNFTNKSAFGSSANVQDVYYGVVRPAWLNDQNKSGFTITCLSHDSGNGMAMFMNNYSTLTV